MLCAPPVIPHAAPIGVVLVPDNSLVSVRSVQGVAERSSTVLISYHGQAYLTLAKAFSQILSVVLLQYQRQHLSSGSNCTVACCSMALIS